MKLKKKLITMILLAASTTTIATEYIIKMDSKNSVIVEDLAEVANENGFFTNGTHKDTGTLYNPNGYDIDGYDTNGYGIKVCKFERYAPITEITMHYNGGNKGISWEGVNEGSMTNGATFLIVNGYKYTMTGGSHYRASSINHYSACRQAVKL
jgi:hypothetical protein